MMQNWFLISCAHFTISLLFWEVLIIKKAHDIYKHLYYKDLMNSHTFLWNTYAVCSNIITVDENVEKERSRDNILVTRNWPPFEYEAYHHENRTARSWPRQRYSYWEHRIFYKQERGIQTSIVGFAKGSKFPYPVDWF